MNKTDVISWKILRTVKQVSVFWDLTENLFYVLPPFLFLSTSKDIVHRASVTSRYLATHRITLLPLGRSLPVSFSSAVDWVALLKALQSVEFVWQDSHLTCGRGDPAAQQLVWIKSSRLVRERYDAEPRGRAIHSDELWFSSAIFLTTQYLPQLSTEQQKHNV